jgi:hypothetical protein
MSVYSEKFKDPMWQKKRLEIMSRDEFKCVICGDDKKTLNVHHCYYIFGLNPWEYSNDVLITLCEDCHKDTHLNSKNETKEAFEAIRKISCKFDLVQLAEALKESPDGNGIFLGDLAEFIHFYKQDK